MERMGTRTTQAALAAAQLFLVLAPSLAYGVDITEVTGLVGLAEKFGVVSILVVALYIAFKEIMSQRGRNHALRNQANNINAAREMWKTAYFRCAAPNDPDMKTMLEREERLLAMLEVA